MPKKITIITIGAIALVVVGAAVYLGLSQAPTQEQQKQGGQGMREEQQPVATLPEPTSPEIDTSDWKTYRNEKYGFEVRYPNDWQLSPYSDEGEQIFFPIGGLDPYSPNARGDEYWITVVRIVAIAGVKDKPAEEAIKTILERTKRNALREEVLYLPNVSISVHKRIEFNDLDSRIELSAFIPNKARPINSILHFSAPYNQRTQKERQEAEAIFDAIVQSIRFLGGEESEAW